jgi:glyoxylase-like metal-dependent hydrolase (beta-lactamase superfamily II)
VTWTVDIIEVGTLPDTALGAYVYGALDEVVLDVPCFCWLLRDGQRSLLVDTGPDLEQSLDVGYEVGGEPRASLLAGLESCAVSPADVDLIVHTHLHQDHVQNDALFPNARVVVQHEELRSALAAEASCGLLSAAAREALAAGPYAESQAAGVWYRGIASLSSALSDRLCVVDGRHELLPGITLLPNGGHTSGHQSVLVDTDEGAVCLCGDIVSLSINCDVVGPMTPDDAATRAFLGRLRAEAWEPIPAHEPAMRRHRWFVESGHALARSQGDTPEAARP